MNRGTACNDCIRCAEIKVAARGVRATLLEPELNRMFLCPTCGNKRCPKATYHDNKCTGSNAPGQEGSDYK